jgi:hypothetical protein
MSYKSPAVGLNWHAIIQEHLRKLSCDHSLPERFPRKLTMIRALDI